MSTPNSMDYVVELLLDKENGADAAMAVLLAEADESRIIRTLGGEATLLNYLIKFEQYVDEHDLYLFQGWEEAGIVQKPKVEKFWVTFYLHVPKGADLQGAKRLTNDKEAQNKIKYKKLEDGSFLVVMKILKRYLDEIEKRNQERSDNLSDEELEEQ